MKKIPRTDPLQSVGQRSEKGVAVTSEDKRKSGQIQVLFHSSLGGCASSTGHNSAGSALQCREKPRAFFTKGL